MELVAPVKLVGIVKLFGLVKLADLVVLVDPVQGNKKRKQRLCLLPKNCQSHSGNLRQHH